MRLNQLGETRLINLIRQTVRARGWTKLGIGDDACILKDGRTVITTDSYAAGVHFDSTYMSDYDIGRRCACACLSDIVAMAAEPRVLLVALATPATKTARDIRRLYQGIEAVCAELNCEVAGGDIIRLDRLVITLTALGSARKPCRRATVRPGDYLYFTGYAGLAETGRLLLASDTRPPELTTRACREAVNRHLFPLPRIQTMRKLRPHITALIDTSDGIATDARHLAEESGCRIVINTEQIPLHPATRALCQHLSLNPVHFALVSGEDYELLFTTHNPLPRHIDRIPITLLGRTEKGTGLYIKTQNRIQKLKLKGYDHLSR